MKKFYVILAVLMMAMYGMFVSCTSEDEEYVYNHQYTYSPKEISEI